MADTIFPKQCFNQLIAKVGTSITNDRPWGAKSGEDIFFINTVTLLPSLLGNTITSTHFDT